MIGLLPILARWRVGLGLFGALAFLGLALAANHYRHAYHAEKALRAADKANYTAAQAEAALIAKRALDATEARYRSKADEADRTYQNELADARASADAYIRAHRVRVQAAQSDASGTASGSQGGGPGVPASVPSNTLVAVSDSDVQACTSAVTYAIGAHEWALSLAH